MSISFAEPESGQGVNVKAPRTSDSGVRGSLTDTPFPQGPENGLAEPILLSQRNAARALAISERSLYEWTHAGRVPYVRLGRRVLYQPDALRRWVRSHQHGPDTAGNCGETGITQPGT